MEKLCMNCKHYQPGLANAGICKRQRGIDESTNAFGWCSSHKPSNRAIGRISTHGEEMSTPIEASAIKAASEPLVADADASSTSNNEQDQGTDQRSERVRKLNAARQERHRQRKREAGLVLVSEWVTPEVAEQIRELIENSTK